MAEDIALNDPLLMPADASGTTQPPASRRSSLTTALWKFLPHSWNELLTITIAVVSLVISLNTSQSQNNRELREQLTDTLDHRLAISLQLQKIGQDMQATTDAKAAIKLQGDLSTLGAQDYALVAQAAELARKIPDEVMWVDYMILANGFAFSGDHRTAERYYLQTLDAAKDSAFATQGGEQNSRHVPSAKSLDLHVTYLSRVYNAHSNFVKPVLSDQWAVTTEHTAVSRDHFIRMSLR